MARALRSPDLVGGSGAVAPPSVRTVRGENKTNVQPKYPAYGTTQSREASFRAGSVWPEGRQQKTAELASAGFFFAGILDCIRCFFCGIGLKNWQLGDDPISEHQKYSPNCAYLKKEIQRRLFAKPGKVGKSKRGLQRYRTEMQNSDTFEGYYSRTSARYPHYFEKVQRSQSYVFWPPEKQPTPDQLAEAGFYHAGPQDCTRCFYCGGGIMDWSPGDIPDVEHARWFSHCQYIISKKGQNFVNNVKINHPRHTETDGPKEEPKFEARDFDDLTEKIQKSSSGKALEIQGKLSKFHGDYAEDDAIFRMELLRIGAPEQRAESGQRDTKGEVSGLSDKMSKLLVENRKLRDERTCKICLEKEVCVVFLPCRHFLTCDDCHSSLSKCPLCRGEITSTIKVFK